MPELGRALGLMVRAFLGSRAPAQKTAGVPLNEPLHIALSRITELAGALERACKERDEWRETAREQAKKYIDLHHFLENFTAAPLLSWVEGTAIAKYGRQITTDSVYAAINSLANSGFMTDAQYEFFRGSLNEPLYVPGRLSLNVEDHNWIIDAIACQSVANMPKEP